MPFYVLFQTKLDAYQLKQIEGADLNQDQKVFCHIFFSSIV